VLVLAHLGPANDVIVLTAHHVMGDWVVQGDMMVMSSKSLKFQKGKEKGKGRSKKDGESSNSEVMFSPSLI